MPTYTCHDTYGEHIEIEADTPDDAADEYISGGDYPDTLSTERYHIVVTHGDVSEVCVTQVDPNETVCDDGADHDWRDEDGPIGHGGGVIYTERCSACALLRRVDTWATDHVDGSVYRSVTYS